MGTAVIILTMLLIVAIRQNRSLNKRVKSMIHDEKNCIILREMNDELHRMNKILTDSNKKLLEATIETIQKEIDDKEDELIFIRAIKKNKPSFSFAYSEQLKKTIHVSIN